MTHLFNVNESEITLETIEEEIASNKTRLAYLQKQLETMNNEARQVQDIINSLEELCGNFELESY